MSFLRPFSVLLTRLLQQPPRYYPLNIPFCCIFTTFSGSFPLAFIYKQNAKSLFYLKEKKKNLLGSPSLLVGTYASSPHHWFPQCCRPSGSYSLPHSLLFNSLLILCPQFPPHHPANSAQNTLQGPNLRFLLSSNNLTSHSLGLPSHPFLFKTFFPFLPVLLNFWSLIISPLLTPLHVHLHKCCCSLGFCPWSSFSAQRFSSNSAHSISVTFKNPSSYTHLGKSVVPQNSSMDLFGSQL